MTTKFPLPPVEVPVFDSTTDNEPSKCYDYPESYDEVVRVPLEEGLAALIAAVRGKRIVGSPFETGKYLCVRTRKG